jgi:peptidoglycan/LPS O-acetylase OafA/YrhL
LLKKDTLPRQDSISILDSLRAVAALMVCLFHSAFILAPFFPAAAEILDVGQEGVYVFFVISGMVMPWSMERMGYRISDFKVFMGKRIVRLQPPMIVSACIVALSSWAMLNTPQYNGWQLLAASATLTAPFFDLPWVNGIYWTLFVEMQYYVYIALAFPLLTATLQWKRLLTVCVILAFSFVSVGMDGNVAKSNLPFHLPVFLMGYYLFMNYKGRITLREFWTGFSLCLIVCFYHTVVAHGLGYRIFLTALSTSMIIYFFRKGWNWLSAIGEVSYSLYLMHWPVISTMCFILGAILKTPLGNAFVFTIIQVAAVGVAFLFYRAIEKPSMRWAKSLRYKRPLL